MRIELTNVNTNKLHDELIKGGIIPSLVESLDITTWVTVQNNDEIKTMEIVALHNPIPLPQSKTELELMKERTEAVEGALVFFMEL